MLKPTHPILIAIKVLEKLCIPFKAPKQLLKDRGIKYDRERQFKGLTTIENRPLRVDVAFQKAEQWHLIEYHGTHHYFKRSASTKRFQNILRNMEIKRQWCAENNVRYLEIPFFRQNEIQELVEDFLDNEVSDNTCRR